METNNSDIVEYIVEDVIDNVVKNIENTRVSKEKCTNIECRCNPCTCNPCNCHNKANLSSSKKIIVYSHLDNFLDSRFSNIVFYSMVVGLISVLPSFYYLYIN